MVGGSILTSIAQTRTPAREDAFMNKATALHEASYVSVLTVLWDGVARNVLLACMPNPKGALESRQALPRIGSALKCKQLITSPTLGSLYIVQDI